MNLEKYRNERREARTEKVIVKPLAAYFDEGKQPEFTVRGLTGAELARCNEAAARQQDKVALAAALIGGDVDAKAAALKELTDGPEVPNDTAKRIQMLELGCVEPQLQHSDAMLLSEDFPVEFMQLTNTITKLTGAGRVLGKQNASGEIQTSETV